MDKKQKMYAQIEKHGKDLNAIFQTDFAPVALCKKLFSLDKKAHKIAEDYCNGYLDSEKWEVESDKIINKAHKILGKEKCIETGLFVNGDPRGYSLKLSANWIEGFRNKGGSLYTDWGGYGIVAPEFNGK